MAPDIDWERVKANLDRLTPESLRELQGLIEQELYSQIKHPKVNLTIYVTFWGLWEEEGRDMAHLVQEYLRTLDWQELGRIG